MEEEVQRSKSRSLSSKDEKKHPKATHRANRQDWTDPSMSDESCSEGVVKKGLKSGKPDKSSSDRSKVS